MSGWRYDDPPLVWLFVAAYAAHVVEEFFGGFPQWVALVAGRPLPVREFAIINAFGLAAMVAAARVSTRREPLAWLAIGVATVVLVNALLHLLGSLLTGTYSPGLITGVVLYLPLGLLLLLRASHQAPASFLLRDILTGLAAHALVLLIAFSSARLT